MYGIDVSETAPPDMLHRHPLEIRSIKHHGTVCLGVCFLDVAPPDALRLRPLEIQSIKRRGFACLG